VCDPLQKESILVRIPVLCPHCPSDEVITGGKTTAGQQRSKCQSTGCPHDSYQRDRLDTGRAPALCRSTPLHDLVIGVCVNREACGCRYACELVRQAYGQVHSPYLS